MYNYDKVLNDKKYKEICTYFLEVCSDSDSDALGRTSFILTSFMLHTTFIKFEYDLPTNKVTEIECIEIFIEYLKKDLKIAESESVLLTKQFEILTEKNFIQTNNFHGIKTYKPCLEFIVAFSKHINMLSDVLNEKIKYVTKNVEYNTALFVSYCIDNTNPLKRTILKELLYASKPISVVTLKKHVKEIEKTAYDETCFDLQIFELKSYALIDKNSSDEIFIINDYNSKNYISIYLENKLNERQAVQKILAQSPCKIHDAISNLTLSEKHVLDYITNEFLHKTYIYFDDNKYNPSAIFICELGIKNYLKKNNIIKTKDEINIILQELEKQKMIEFSFIGIHKSYILQINLFLFVLISEERVAAMIERKLAKAKPKLTKEVYSYVLNLLKTKKDVSIVFKYIISRANVQNIYIISGAKTIKDLQKKQIDKTTFELCIKELQDMNIFTCSYCLDLYSFYISVDIMDFITELISN